MRRLLAILVLVSFNIGLLGPMLSSETSPQLPACCRTHGAHHCALHMRAQASGPSIDAPAHCPYFPPPNVFPARAQAAPSGAIPDTIGAPASAPAPPAQPNLLRRLSLARTIPQRGPPLSV